MEPKESKSLRHFHYSLAKSMIRIGACLLYLGAYPKLFVCGLILAELLGIKEEL